MNVSCGVILTDISSILLGHSTGNNFWDIPKGMLEEDETFVQAAIRETKEEFGLILHEDELIDIGLFDYNKYKMLYLFKKEYDVLPHANECYCSSQFEIANGLKFDEIDAYKKFSISSAVDNMSNSLAKVFTKIMGDL
jgi:8-oxo-dGTP pyrophosphatase MutT (NUDIX family)